MPVTFTNDRLQIDWDELVIVFDRAPLGRREPDVLRQTFLNSGVCCFAHLDGRLVGAGRAITDGIRYAVIFDVVVSPELQGQGIGTAIMDNLRTASGAASVLLYAAPGKQGFYEKLGYRRMKTAMALFANPEAQRRYGVIE